MWTVEHVRDLPVVPRVVWEYYADPTSWARWAHNTAWARFDDELRPGVRGQVKPVSGPVQAISVRHVVPERLLVTEARPPGARMEFRYEITPTATGVKIRHALSMTGPLAGLYGILIRRRNERQIPEETARLGHLVG